MHDTGAQGWCTGKIQRDGVGRKAGRGIGMGNKCKSMADSCQCMAKKHYNIVISPQRIKINGKKTKTKTNSNFFLMLSALQDIGRLWAKMFIKFIVKLTQRRF